MDYSPDYSREYIDAISRICGGYYNGVGLENENAWRGLLIDERNGISPIAGATTLFLRATRYNIFDNGSYEDPYIWFRKAVNAISIIDEWVKQGKLKASFRDEINKLINDVIERGTRKGKIPYDELIELGLSE